MTKHIRVPEESESLGELVRQRRERYGLSLREAAKQSGCSFSTIDRVEHGREPSFGSFVLLARWLGLEAMEP